MPPSIPEWSSTLTFRPTLEPRLIHDRASNGSSLTQVRSLVQTEIFVALITNRRPTLVQLTRLRSFNRSHNYKQAYTQEANLAQLSSRYYENHYRRCIICRISTKLIKEVVVTFMLNIMKTKTDLRSWKTKGRLLLQLLRLRHLAIPAREASIALSILVMHSLRQHWRPRRRWRKPKSLKETP